MILLLKFVYRCSYTTETDLLCVSTDIVNIVGKGNGSDLVLLDVASTFDQKSMIFHLVEFLRSITKIVY